MIMTTRGVMRGGRDGMALCHEHVHAAFGDASGDPDLGFTDAAAVAADLRRAHGLGVSMLVEVSTRDMCADVEVIDALAGDAGVAVIKSTGWYKSPSLDREVADRTPTELTDQLLADHYEGIDGSVIRAGVIGESGMSGRTATPGEVKVLTASAQASAITGLGIVLHTDSWENTTALVAQVTSAGAERSRLLVGHVRASDPLAGQVELARRGATLAFDQVGHPARDPVAAVAVRLCELWEQGVGERVAVSGDVGRLSRLTSMGGSGYIDAVMALRRELVARGLGETELKSLLGGAVIRWLDPDRSQA